MKPAFVVGGARVFHGDCVDVLKQLPENSVDSIVTDPPYGLEFMGKDWDAPWKKSGDVIDNPASVGGFQDGAGGNPFSRSRIRYGRDNGAMIGFQLWATEWAVECLRVLKPGGHILAFGGSRTWHRLAVAVEDAGFELRDSIAWIYGSGFPKSLDVSKAIAGHKKFGTSSKSQMRQAVMGDNYVPSLAAGSIGSERSMTGGRSTPPEITAELPTEAQQWQGWGTALKPAFEPVVVGRKPFGKGVTVAENVLAWGVGGLNIDGSRIQALAGESFARPVNHTNLHEGWQRPWHDDPDSLQRERAKRDEGEAKAQSLGRWPANVILDEVTAGLLDQQSGERGASAKASGATLTGASTSHSRGKFNGVEDTPFYGDSGGASRFFYVAKASKRDRNEGLEELEARSNRINAPRENENQKNATNKQNFHPTVKPTALMRYLIKLVTPPGGTVLDPFTGSGSTGKAALLDGFQFVGVELTEEYLPIIEGRLRWANEQEETDERLF